MKSKNKILIFFTMALLLVAVGVSNATIIRDTATSIFTGDVEIEGTTTTKDFITEGPYIDVRAFGVLGDGITDNAINIELALNNNNSIILFPPGEYIINGTVPHLVNLVNVTISAYGASFNCSYSNGEQVSVVQELV